jgi:hypothetical protein
MNLGTWQLDDLLTFPCNTHTPATGAATDADSVPAYRVYEDETGTPILTGSMAKLDDAGTTGFYSEQITLSAANGFEVGKSYTIHVAATVGGVTGTLSHTFQVEAAPATAAALSTVAGYLDTEVAAILAAVDTEVAAILAGQSTLALLIAALDDLSAAQVQAAVAAALAAYPVPLIATIEAAIAAGSGATPATFWGYTGPGGRTLTQSMIAILSSMIEGSAITITRGDNVSVAITGLGSLAGRTGLWFTVKARPATDTDLQAKIQATEDDGLIRLNGAAADDSADGAIAVDDEDNGDITITLSAAASAQLATGVSWRWDVQVAQPGPGVWTPRSGAFMVQEDVTRATG